MRFLRFAAIGAALTYFFDPDNGRRRRALARDRLLALVRKTGRQAGGVAARASGMQQKLAHRQEAEKPQPDDVTLARKVETEIFREPDVPKGQINVNAEHGVVYLRGEIDSPDLIRELEERTRAVQGVQHVENLLHAPGTPAPTSG